MIAGVSLTEQRELEPGFLCDLYVLRRDYDDEQHGVVRASDDHDIDAEDYALFDHYDEIAAAEKNGGLSVNGGSGDQNTAVG